MSAELAHLLRALQIVLGLVASAFAWGPASTSEVKCFSHPSRCGYPDAGNTGVPRGTRLARSGSITIRRDGRTVEGLHVIGTVTVAADDVTIRNSLITRRSGGRGTAAVILAEGADGFEIRDTEVRGPRHGRNGLESAIWNHYDNRGARAVRVHFHRCADCWEGSGAFRDSLMVVDAAFPGSHDEDIYVCGGSVRVRHSTLINRHRQTAVVFGDALCGGNAVSIEDSLLAGGGFLVYPQANSSSRVGRMNISGNRFARCTTAPVFRRHSGGRVCRAGPDAGGLFPGGGFYGVAADYFRGRGQVWRGNVWDDNLRPAHP